MARMVKGNIEEELENEFHVSRAIIVYKFALGLVEFLSGSGLLVWGSQAFGLYQSLLTRELSEDPHDVLAHLTERVIPALFAQHVYLAGYLVLLGGAKLAGAVGLIYGQNWGVDLLVGLTVVLFPFQVIGLIRNPAILDFIYLGVGLLIALYLVNFKPRAWVSRMVFRVENQIEKIRRPAGRG